MSNKILILFAHPRYENSINHRVLIGNIPSVPGITFHDLYQLYPDFNIDLESEKKLLLEHDIIIWQHPFYWYSSPPLLKQWIDLVLEFGWAYGPGGTALKNKIVFNVLTAGGPRTAYQKDGYNRFTINELLSPFDQTAVLCKMVYLPPFVVHGTHRISTEDLNGLGKNYQKLLELLVDGSFDISHIKSFPYLNDWVLSINH